MSARSGRRTLAAGTVHVWSIGLDPPRTRLDELRGWLCAEERQRAARFRFARHRDRFVAARGQLREILAGYEDVEPAALRFAYGAHGKPRLAGGSVRFNLSHSDGEALLAVAAGRDVGIDLERVRPDADCTAVARRFFSRAEATALLALPPAARAAAFFAVWTRKEAFVKARGDGLAVPLADFDVSIAALGPVRLLRTAWDPAEAGRWSLRTLDVAPGFAAALAVFGPQPEVRRWDARLASLGA